MKSFLLVLVAGLFFSANASAQEFECTNGGEKTIQVELSSQQWMKVTFEATGNTVEGSAVRQTRPAEDVEFFRVGRTLLYRKGQDWTLFGTDYTCKDTSVVL